MYNEIFTTNVLRLLGERKMTRQELSEKSGVSISFVSDVTNVKGNPSLKTMEAIADALGVPLPMMLEVTDLDADAMRELAGPKSAPALPKGYARVWAVLPEHQAFIVSKWAEEAKSRMRKD